MALDFWFEFASTYSYPAAMRIEALARARGVEIRWRPFLLGPIFQDQGWNDSPFNLYPAKGRYMWRDLARVCGSLGLPLRLPGRFPRNGLLAARIACGHEGEPWVPEFVRSVYTANFAEDLEISDQGVVSRLIGRLGLDARDVLARAASEPSKGRLREQTEEARQQGIFGAPSFVVGDELYWGNDRLEAAIEHAAGGRLALAVPSRPAAAPAAGQPATTAPTAREE